MTRWRALVCLVAAGVTALGTVSAHAATVAAPTVTSVAPSIGLVAGGARVTVTGSGFSGVRSVIFGRAAGTAVHVLSSTKLQVTSPPHYESTVHIQVVTGAGKSRAVHQDEFRFRYAPTPVGTPSVVDTTATSIALTWVASTDPTAVVEVHRAAGSTAPTVPSRTDLVATLPVGTTHFRDTGLTGNRQYAYALFTKADGLYSRTGPARTGRTTSTARPAEPELVETIPSALPDCLDSGAILSPDDEFRVLARVAAPDTQQATRLHTEMRLVDYGTAGTATPVQVIGYADDLGWSDSAYAPGSVLTRMYMDDFQDGHEYGFTLVAVDESDHRSGATPECRFVLDSTPPTQSVITAQFPPDGVARVGHAATFTISSSDPVSVPGRSSGLAEFEYTFAGCYQLPGGGTHVAATGSDGATASITFTYTPTTWGPATLCVMSMDAAGNVSPPVTYQFYVVDSSVPARVSAR